MIRQIIGSLAGPAKEKQKQCYTAPAATLGAEEDPTYREATLRQISMELRYEVKSINEGLAGFTPSSRIPITQASESAAAAGLYNVCLSYLSIPVLSFPVPRPAIISIRVPSAAQGRAGRTCRIRRT